MTFKILVVASLVVATLAIAPPGRANDSGPVTVPAAQALESPGQARVQLGKLDEAAALLACLRPLDAKEADELAQAIADRKR